jgi:polysaccharide biosynthesis transport protein
VTVQGEETDGELELRDYLRVLRRRRWIVLVTIGVVVGIATIVSYLQTPVYSGTAQMLIQPRAGTSPFEAATGQAVGGVQFVATEIEVIKGEPVQEGVRAQLGSAPAVAVRQVGTTAVVQIVAESTDPEKAAAVANAYVDSYIDHRRQQGVDESLAAQDEVQGKIDRLQGQIDGLDAQIATAEGAVADSLRSQRQALLQQQALFKQTLDQLQVNMALITGGAERVRSAVVPTSPVKPTPLRNGVLALVVGSLLGVGLAFLAEYLDDSIETQEELERVIGSVPVIALIPEVAGWKSKEKSRLVAADAPRSPAAEAYRALRTAIQFIGLNQPLTILQVTSPNAGEGKTTTLANLGITLAAGGKRVVIVCCDLRRPRVHEFFGLSNKVGFTSTLLGDRPVSAALQAVPGIPRLRLLASGPLPPNPSELLSSKRTADVFAALAADSDIVLIDSPPVLPVTDALVLFQHVDATLLVFSAGNTTRKEAAAALGKVQQVKGPVIGAVLNGVKAESGYGYTYGYESASGSGTDPTGGNRVARNGGDRSGADRVGTGKNGSAGNGLGNAAKSRSSAGRAAGKARFRR